jgi:hypothetical protein
VCLYTNSSSLSREGRHISASSKETFSLWGQPSECKNKSVHMFKTAGSNLKYGNIYLVL